ncbi:MAG: HAD hydrolase-like protein [Lutibacter sp.]|nr:HAD hydrolase-like protein [Lutibacter sp.]
MDKSNNLLQELSQKISNNDILFFDMDGTLVDTDFANYLSYKKAIESVTQSVIKISYNSEKRFNRSVLKGVIPNLKETEYEKIIQEKERYYADFLPKTRLRKSATDILFKYSKTNKCVLITNCRKDRALITLDYFDLTDKFSNIFYRQLDDNKKKINKYKNAISCLDISPKAVIVIENEQTEILDAIVAGIPAENILSI